MFHLFRWFRERLVQGTDSRDSTGEPASGGQSAVPMQPRVNRNSEPPDLFMVDSKPRSDRIEVTAEHAKPTFSRGVPIHCADPKRTAYFTPGMYAPWAPHLPRCDRLHRSRPPGSSVSMNSRYNGTFRMRSSHRREEQE